MPQKSKRTTAPTPAKSPVPRRRSIDLSGGRSAPKQLMASIARIPTKTFNQVVYRGERVQVKRRDGDSLYLVPREDVELLRRLEDRADLAVVRKRRGEKAIPLEQVKRELGL